MNDASVFLSTAPRHLASVSLPAALDLVDISLLLASPECSPSSLSGVPVVPQWSFHLPLPRLHWFAPVLVP